MKVESNLSGTPEVVLYMSIPNEFEDYSIHQCLYGKTFSLENEKVLNFIVPNGNFSLLSYTIRDVQPRYPFEIFVHREKLKQNEINLLINVEKRLVRGKEFKTKDFHIKMMYPEDMRVVMQNSTFGDFTSNADTHAGLWRIG